MLESQVDADKEEATGRRTGVKAKHEAERQRSGQVKMKKS